MARLTNRKVDSLGVLRLVEITALLVVLFTIVLQDKDIHVVHLSLISSSFWGAICFVPHRRFKSCWSKMPQKCNLSMVKLKILL